MSPARLPPESWYPDPGGSGGTRYWDGTDWTDAVADRHGRVSQVPLPPEGGAAAWAALEDHRRRFSGWTALLAVGAFVLSSVIGGVLAYAGDQVNSATALLLGATGNYGCLFLTCWLVSRWRGTGDLRADYGLQPRRGDWWRGLLVAVGSRVAGIVVVALLLLLSRDLAGSNTADFDAHKDSLGFLLVAAMVAVVMAPFFEELFFRGLLLQSFEGSFPAPVAIVLQGLLFGLAHLGGAEGVGNIGLVAGLATAGIVFGIAARRYHRIVPGMVAHALFNALPVAVLIATR